MPPARTLVLNSVAILELRYTLKYVHLLLVCLSSIAVTTVEWEEVVRLSWLAAFLAAVDVDKRCCDQTSSVVLTN